MRRIVITLLICAGAVGALMTPSAAHDGSFGSQGVWADAWDWNPTRYASATTTACHYEPLVDHSHSGIINATAHVGAAYDGETEAVSFYTGDIFVSESWGVSGSEQGSMSQTAEAFAATTLYSPYDSASDSLY